MALSGGATLVGDVNVLVVFSSCLATPFVVVLSPEVSPFGTPPSLRFITKETHGFAYKYIECVAHLLHFHNMFCP